MSRRCVVAPLAKHHVGAAARPPTVIPVGSGLTSARTALPEEDLS